jgi:hypothetical protein
MKLLSLSALSTGGALYCRNSSCRDHQRCDYKARQPHRLLFCNLLTDLLYHAPVAWNMKSVTHVVTEEKSLGGNKIVRPVDC